MMKKRNGVLSLIGVIGFAMVTLSSTGAKTEPLSLRSNGYAGSVSCRECHDKFYNLWSTSFHGLAMQPFTPEFAKANLSPQKADIQIGKNDYCVQFDNTSGWVRERSPDGEKTYGIKQVMGGKNVFYLLAPTERGRLQVLPVA